MERTLASPTTLEETAFRVIAGLSGMGDASVLSTQPNLSRPYELRSPFPTNLLLKAGTMGRVQQTHPIVFYPTSWYTSHIYPLSQHFGHIFDERKEVDDTDDIPHAFPLFDSFFLLIIIIKEDSVATETKRSGYFTGWTEKQEGIIAPDERLPWGQTIFVGLQHVLAMFGSTVLGPILMGFNPNTAIFFSGIGTILFFLVVGGRVPSYLGSSFAFIAVVIAATAYSGKGLNPHIDVALGGIIAAGVVYAIIAAIVIFAGYRWIEYLMPPAVTGAVVAVIGLNLAPVAVNEMSTSQFDTVMALVTLLAVGLIAVYAPGTLRRLPILLGGIIGYLLYLLFANGFGFGKPIDFTNLSKAAWIGLPSFTAPSFQPNAMTLIAPVAIILVAENLGHVKAVGAMTGRNLDPYLGRAFLGDSLATILAGFGGGTGVTTYAENIGVMAVTRIYSTVVFLVAAVVAILLGFSPKFGALIATIPLGVLGGLATVLFGLIAATGGRIWVQNRVDFSSTRNLITIAVALIMGAGNFTINLGNFSIGGIGTATFSAIIIYQLLRGRKPQAEEVPVAEPAIDAGE